VGSGGQRPGPDGGQLGRVKFLASRELLQNMYILSTQGS
jgi:hypothetical protein